MSSGSRARLVCAALIYVSISAPRVHADPAAIDLQAALARAMARAPEAIAALGRIREVEARGAGARVRFEANPEVELGAGRRSGDAAALQLEGRIAQPLEPGRRGRADRRRRRRSSAGSGPRRRSALRELAFAVEAAFDEARHAQLVVELAARGRGPRGPRRGGGGAPAQARATSRTSTSTSRRSRSGARAPRSAARRVGARGGDRPARRADRRRPRRRDHARSASWCRRRRRGRAGGRRAGRAPTCACSTRRRGSPPPRVRSRARTGGPTSGCGSATSATTGDDDRARRAER